MPFKSKRPPLRLTPEETARLTLVAKSRTEGASCIQRARLILAYASGESISSLASRFRTNRPKVDRCIDKALQVGAVPSLRDLPGRGRPPAIPPDARAWVVSLACRKPKDLGYSYELWTTQLLMTHIRKYCLEAGHPSLGKLSRGTVSKLLTQNQVRPHKITYYLERRDPEFDAKMAQVLCVYKEVALLRQAGGTSPSMIAILSYDEKPGIQAIENTAPDLPPVPGKHPTITRDYEYVRHGTRTLMAAIDLLSGKVYGIVVERHRSREFIQFLQKVSAQFPSVAKIRIVLDNHSAHISKETRAYLATVPNRFEFVFTPKHGSWLNLIESFFGKMAKSVLRGIRVSSAAELEERIMQYLEEINEAPVVFRWKYGIDTASVR